jgi:hypothetical protein
MTQATRSQECRGIFVAPETTCEVKDMKLHALPWILIVLGVALFGWSMLALALR